jgi:hypothetical protein
MSNSDSGIPLQPEQAIEASEEFWDIYFGGRVSRLERDSSGSYRGVYEVGVPGRLLPLEQPFSAKRSVLDTHDYQNDVRFWPEICDDFRHCLLEVLASPLMYEDMTPHRNQLETLITTYHLDVVMTEDYAQLHDAVIEALRSTDPTLDQALHYVEIHQPTEHDYSYYEETSDTSFLATQRDIFIKAFGMHTTDQRIVDMLYRVVDSEFVDEGTATLAIWAIGRQNNKASIPVLLNWLSAPRMTRYSVTIERALQYICSGPKLIPLSYDKELAYWRETAESLPGSDAEWVVHDSTSVFWEKRLRCAVQYPAGFADELSRLAGDEVHQVRDAAANAAQSK